MCIAIYKPAKVTIYAEVLRDCFCWHSDGAGFVAHDPETNTLIIKKGFFTFKDFMRAFQPYKRHQCLIHFRLATHGKTDTANCHPFMVGDDLAFIHNGVLNSVKEWDKNFSDTWHFNELTLKPLYESYGPSIMNHKTIRFLIERFIGRSKLIFMDSTGKVTIYNEKAGEWNCRCWFSNDTYKYTPQDVRKYLGYDPKDLIPDKKEKEVTTLPSLQTGLIEAELVKADGGHI